MKLETGTIIVVDSDDDVRNVIADLLLDAGIEVAQAASAEEGICLLRQPPPGVMLCHLELLREKGARLLQCAKQLEPRPRIVAMSAGGEQASPTEADANLAKPFTRAQLLAALAVS